MLPMSAKMTLLQYISNLRTFMIILFKARYTDLFVSHIKSEVKSNSYPSHRLGGLLSVNIHDICVASIITTPRFDRCLRTSFQQAIWMAGSSKHI